MVDALVTSPTIAGGAVSIPVPRVTGREKSVNLDFIDENGMTINELHFESVVPGEMPREKEITITNGGTSNVNLTLQCIASVINPLGSGLDTYLSTFFSTDQIAYSNTLDVTVNSSGSQTFYLKYLPPSTAIPGEKQWTFNPQINDTESGAPPGWENYRDWLYYDYFTITGNGTAETDYPIEKTILYSVGMMNTDFSDLRFVDENGTELNYGIYSKTDSDTATFIIELPVLPATPDTARIYVYTGNPNALSQSNLNDVVLFYDNFSGTVLDNEKWIEDAGSITQSINNGRLEVTTATSCRIEGLGSWCSRLKAAATLTDKYRVKANVGIVNSYSVGFMGIALGNSLDNTTAAISGFSNLGGQPGDTYLWSQVNNHTQAYESYGGVQEYSVDVKIDVEDGVAKIYVNNILKSEGDIDTTLPDGLFIVVGAQPPGWGYYIPGFLDNVLITKHIENEPTISDLSGTWKFVSKNLEIKAGLLFKSKYLPGVTPIVKHSVKIGGYVYD